MATKRHGIPVVTKITKQPTTGSQLVAAAQGLRPPQKPPPYVRNDGLRIVLRKIPGLTKGPGFTTPFYFQCPPLNEFGHTHGQAQNRYNTATSGEFSRRAGGRQLAQFPFQTLVVEWGAFVSVYKFDLEKMVDALIDISEHGYPFRLIAAHTYNDRPELDTPATLDSVRVTERGDESDARYLDLTFTEYRAPLVQRVGIAPASKSKSGIQIVSTQAHLPPIQRIGSKPFPAAVRVSANGAVTYPPGFSGPSDPSPSLTTLATDFYGKPSLARELAQSLGVTGYSLYAPIAGYSRYRKGGVISVPSPSTVGSRGTVS
jgi:hypothetical protein